MIRRATPADAAALSTLARECFTQAFAHLYEPADLAAFLDEAYAPAVLRAELEDPERATWLLFKDAPEEGGTATANPIGYVSARPAHLPHPEVAPGDGEVQRLYVLDEYQGGGRGTLLLGTALAWLERHGPRPLWIGVWSKNLGAQRLYERHGFTVVGEYSFMVGNHADKEFIARRDARSGPAGNRA